MAETRVDAYHPELVEGLLGGCTCGHKHNAHTYDCQISTGFNEHHAVRFIDAELDRARSRFAAFNSPHEGYAVLREELEELWEHVRGNTGDSLDARVEALQLAAMALRYALDLTGTLPTGYDIEARVALLVKQGIDPEEARRAVA